MIRTDIPKHSPLSTEYVKSITNMWIGLINAGMLGLLSVVIAAYEIYAILSFPTPPAMALIYIFYCVAGCFVLFSTFISCLDSHDVYLTSHYFVVVAWVIKGTYNISLILLTAFYAGACPPNPWGVIPVWLIEVLLGMDFFILLGATLPVLYLYKEKDFLRYPHYSQQFNYAQLPAHVPPLSSNSLPFLYIFSE